MNDTNTMTFIFNASAADAYQRGMTERSTEWARIRRNFMAQARRRNLLRVSIQRPDRTEIEVIRLRGTRI